MKKIEKQLNKYICHNSAPIIAKWIVDTGCQFKITRSRSSKLGDYRAPFQNQGHRISVNHNLNKYSFLLTTVHEFAHLKTYNEYQNKVEPHGKEWKKNFQLLMKPFLTDTYFPEDILPILKKHMTDPKASSSSDEDLLRALRKHDSQNNTIYYVEDLNYGDSFAIRTGRVFIKREKLRKRYKCVEVKTNRIYLFQPLAEVYPI